MEIGSGGEIMQIKLKIALAATGFALAIIPAVAVEMPTDGSKNFSTPNDAPAYFANEAVPESARVANPATFTSEDVAAAPDVEPAYPSGAETGRHGKHASAHKSAKHALGGSKGYGASTHYPATTASKATRNAALHTAAKNTNAGSRSASSVKAAGKSGMPAGESRSSTTRHAKTGTRQHAAAMPAGASPLAREA
jgi:hypothetical protein